MGSKRTYTVKEILKLRRREADLETNIGAGGSVLLETAQHALDGPEHLESQGTADKLATTTHSGLLLPLSGDADDRLAGDGTWVAGASAEAVAELRAEVHGLFIATYHRASDELPILMTSRDGVTFEDIGAMLGATNVRDPSIIHWDGKFWMIGTRPGTSTFHVYTTPDLTAPWTDLGTFTSDGSATQTWAPEWIKNMDGTPYLHPSTGLPCATINISTDSQSTFTIREIHPTNRGMTAWSATTTITGTGLASKMIDGFLMVDGDDYWLWFKNETGSKIELYHSATALTSGYTVLESGDWAGWYANRQSPASSIEGPCVVRLDDGRWRIYFNENDGFDSVRAVYSETTDDWRTGTSTWTEQAEIVTDALMSHGTVVFIPSVYDHERDPNAHPELVGASALDDLSDVTLTAPAEDDELVFDGAAWVNRAPATPTFREVLMATGITDPPDPLISSDGTDWLYGEAS